MANIITTIAVIIMIFLIIAGCSNLNIRGQ